MPCLRTPSTSSNPNAFEPTNEISLKYSGVSSQNVGPCTPAFTSVPRACSDARADLERLLLADRVVDDVDAARDTPSAARRSAAARRPTTPRPPRSPAIAGSWPITVAPSLRAMLGLRLEARDDEHLDVGVQRAQDRGRARAERAGAVHHHLAARRRRVPRDRRAGSPRTGRRTPRARRARRRAP